MSGARGEAIIQAGGREVRALFTNRSLAEAEQKTGRGILALSRGFITGHCGITEVAALLCAGMEAARRDARAGGSCVTLDDAYDVLEAAGYSQVARVVMEAVTVVLSFDGGAAAAAEDETETKNE